MNSSKQAFKKIKCEERIVSSNITQAGEYGLVQMSVISNTDHYCTYWICWCPTEHFCILAAVLIEMFMSAVTKYITVCSTLHFWFVKGTCTKADSVNVSSDIRDKLVCDCIMVINKRRAKILKRQYKVGSREFCCGAQWGKRCQFFQEATPAIKASNWKKTMKNDTLAKLLKKSLWRSVEWKIPMSLWSQCDRLRLWLLFRLHMHWKQLNKEVIWWFHQSCRTLYFYL